MKIGDTVMVKLKVTEIIEREDGRFITVKPHKEDGAEFFNSITIKEQAITEDYVITKSAL